MAYYRTISNSFWTDAKVVDDFTPEDRYFYLYLLTNPHTNLCGCYELSFKQAADEMGYSKDVVERLINRFIGVHKLIDYSKTTKEIIIINWGRHNWTLSEKYMKGVLKEIDNVKNPHFKQYLEDLIENKDTLSIGYQYPMDITISISNTISNSNTVSDSNNLKPTTHNSVELNRSVEQEIIDSQDSLNLKEDRKPKKRAKKEPVRKDVYFPLDEKLNQAFSDYVEMREKMGAKKAFQSIKAIDAAIDDLMEMANGDNDTAIKIIRKSLMNSWQGLFPLKDVSTTKQKTNYTGSIFENA
jgi:hypothetical protein